MTVTNHFINDVCVIIIVNVYVFLLTTVNSWGEDVVDYSVIIIVINFCTEHAQLCCSFLIVKEEKELYTERSLKSRHQSVPNSNIQSSRELEIPYRGNVGLGIYD